MTESEHRPWKPLTPEQVAEIFASLQAPWWIAGGYAIDAFVGSFDRRPHGDIDVGLLARDQDAARARLAGWDLHCADPPGTLRPWREGEILEEPVHDVWGRPTRSDPWRLALVLNTGDSDVWVYRRDARVRRPLEELVRHVGGIPYLVPDVQLLFKSKNPRPKDEQDFGDSLPLLTSAQREWLGAALRLTQPGHPWLERL